MIATINEQCAMAEADGLWTNIPKPEMFDFVDEQHRRKEVEGNF
jgi:hypothetical protein